MIILDAFDLGFKLSKKSKFADGYLMRLMDIDESEHAKFLETYCREVAPAHLRQLVPGTQITYVRRDNGKIVNKAVIVDHRISRDGDEITMLSFASPSTVVISKNAAARGFVSVPVLAPMRFFIAASNILRLYVQKSMDEMNDRVVALESAVTALSGEKVTLIAALESMARQLHENNCQHRQAEEAHDAMIKKLRSDLNQLTRVVSFLSAKLREVDQRAITDHHASHDPKCRNIEAPPPSLPLDT